jgi:hypothetical protein
VSSDLALNEVLSEVKGGAHAHTEENAAIECVTIIVHLVNNYNHVAFRNRGIRDGHTPWNHLLESCQNFFQ